MAKPTPDQIHYERCRRSPLYWRSHLIVEDNLWGPRMAPVQVEDFQARDPALLYLAGHRDVVSTMPKVRRFFHQRSRGYSKSTDLASDIIWLCVMGKKTLPGVIAASKQEQAMLVMDAIEEIIVENKQLEQSITLLKGGEVRSKVNGSSFVFATANATGAFGARPMFNLFDEFTHCEDEKFWSAFYTSFGKTDHKGGICIVACNAGWGRDWHWDIKETAMTSEIWYHNAPEGHSPWYTAEMLEDQRLVLAGMPEEFNRLWLNQWQDSDGTFVTLGQAEACVDHKLVYRSCPDEELTRAQDTTYYIATLDYAEKIDRTVGLVCHLEDINGEITLIVDRMDVLDPQYMPVDMDEEGQKGIVPVSWCANWLDEIQQTFGTGNCQVYFMIDDDELKFIRDQRVAEGYFIRSFPFSGGKGNYEMSKSLRHYILQKKVKWYDGCGQIMDLRDGEPIPIEKRDDLCTELAALFCKKIANGTRWRMEHQRSGHDDRAFCLGVACWLCDNPEELFK